MRLSTVTNNKISLELKTMRRTLLAFATAGLVGAGLAGIATAASAADIRQPTYKAPPAAVPVATVYNWTGFYVGGHIGYGWGDKDWTDTTGLFGLSHQTDGFLGGGQIGFNYQIGQFVAGIEGDFSWTGLKGETSTLASTFTSEVDWTSTLTGRLGFAWDRFLVYGKGGFAWARDTYTTNFYTIPGAEVRDTRTGWTVGAGLEYALTESWTTKLEYNYMDFGKDTVSFAPGFNTDIDQKIHAVKLGVNYKFGPWGPISARY